MKKFIQFGLFTLLITFGVNVWSMHERYENFDPVHKPQQSQKSLDSNLFFHEHEVDQQHLRNIRTVHQEGDEKGFSRWTRFTRALDHGRHTIANKLGITLKDNPKTVLEKAIQTNTEKFKNNFNFLPQIRKSLVAFREDFSEHNPFKKMDSNKINNILEKYNNDRYLKLNIVKDANLDLTFLNNTAESGDSFKKLSNQKKLEFINEYAKKLQTVTNAIEKNQTEYYELTKIQLDALTKALNTRIETLEKERYRTEAIKNNSNALAQRIQDSHWSTKWLHKGHQWFHDTWHGTSSELQNKSDSLNAEIENLTISKNKANELLTKFETQHSNMNESIKQYYIKTLQKLMIGIDPFIKNENLIVRYNTTTDKFEFHNKNIHFREENTQRIELSAEMRNQVEDRSSPLDNKTSSNLNPAPSRPNITLEDLVTIIKEIKDNKKLNDSQKQNAIEEAIKSNEAYQTAINDHTVEYFFNALKQNVNFIPVTRKVIPDGEHNPRAAAPIGYTGKD